MNKGMLQGKINEKYAMIQKKCLFTNLLGTGNMYTCYNMLYIFCGFSLVHRKVCDIMYSN